MKFPGRVQIAILALTFVLGATGCATTDMPVVPGAITDAESLGLVRTANTSEIQQGEVARTKATNADVRAYAEMMVAEHTRANDRLNEIAGGANISPGETGISGQLQTNTSASVAALNTYSGADFDRAYIQGQIDTHRWLLSNLDQSLIPVARNRDVRAYLTDVRGSVATHLARAEEIQRAIR